jgi:hypothetical protein
VGGGWQASSLAQPMGSLHCTPYHCVVQWHGKMGDQTQLPGQTVRHTIWHLLVMLCIIHAYAFAAWPYILQVELDVSVRRVGSEESVNVRGAGAVIDILGLLPGTKYAIRSAIGSLSQYGAHHFLFCCRQSIDWLGVHAGQAHVTACYMPRAACRRTAQRS